MDYVKTHPLEILGLAVLVVEQVLPHLPIKANSTVQVIINVAKAIIGKKDK